MQWSVASTVVNGHVTMVCDGFMWCARVSSCLVCVCVCVQEAGLAEVKKEMVVETYDIDAVKIQLRDVLIQFVEDLGYVRMWLYTFSMHAFVCTSM